MRRRAELSRELRRSGDRDGAARVAALRKPQLHLWVVNRLARQSPLSVTRLLSAARDLQEAQERAVAGGTRAGERLRRDAGEYQRAIDLAVREAANTLREAGRGTAEETLRRVRDVLAGAALGGEGAREQLKAGSLPEEPAAPALGGFGTPMAGTTADAVSSPRPAAKPQGRKEVAEPDRARPAAAARDPRARQRLVAARRAAEVAAAVSGRAEQAARRLRRRADALAAEAATAEAEARAAERQAASARRAAELADRRVQARLKGAN